MAAKPFVAASDLSVVASCPPDLSAVFADYWAMTKPEINLLIGITTAASFYLASAAELTRFPWVVLLNTLVGALSAASGAAALNQWAEYPFDAKMRRTARRAIAAGRVDPDHALTFGATLSLAGVVYLAVTVGFLASMLALVTLVGYLLVYTPLKRVTPRCTLVGAAPGAAPALIGWAAARGHLDPGAWLLFSIVFFWQFPHFMSIAWMYRDDYDRAGYLVLPDDDLTRDRLVIAQTLLPLLALLSVSLLPVHGSRSLSYSVGALALGCWFFVCGARFTRQRSATAARRLLMVSIIYLPSLLLLMILLATRVSWE
jgi:protoheme IX farnesyltransferase